MRRMNGLVRAGVLLTCMIVGLAAFGKKETAPPRITLFKNPNCSCCNRWADLLRGRGFEVIIDSSGSVAEISEEHGVPSDLGSCHTALVDRYVVVGHVPVEDIIRLLKERPSVVGISVPGMPAGSPGMELEGVAPSPYAVLAFDKAGNKTVFAEHR